MNLLALQAVTNPYHFSTDLLARVTTGYVPERPRGIKRLGVRFTCMGINQTVGATLFAEGLPVLQLGGGLIELAVLFLVLALVAGVFGARGIAGLSMDIAKWLVIIFVVLAIVTFLL